MKSAKSFIVGCFYCPPETSKYHQSNLNDLLQDHLRIIDKENKEIILMGDFNVNYNDTSSNTMFKTIVKLFGFKQLMKKCTRLTETSSTTIDLILSNAAQNISAVDVVHDMVACIRKINHQRYNPRMIKCRDYKNYDHNELCADMINTDWQPLYEILDVNKALDYLNNILGETFSKHAPLIEKRVKGRKCEWLTSELKRLLSEGDKLLRKARRTKDPADWRAYKRHATSVQTKSDKPRRNIIVIC